MLHMAVISMYVAFAFQFRNELQFASNSQIPRETRLIVYTIGEYHSSRENEAKIVRNISKTKESVNHHLMSYILNSKYIL